MFRIFAMMAALLVGIWLSGASASAQYIPPGPIVEATRVNELGTPVSASPTVIGGVTPVATSAPLYGPLGPATVFSVTTAVELVLPEIDELGGARLFGVILLFLISLLVVKGEARVLSGLGLVAAIFLYVISGEDTWLLGWLLFFVGVMVVNFFGGLAGGSTKTA